MTGIRFFILIAGLTATVRGSHPALTIQQTSWRAYYKTLTDTLTLNFGNDSVTVATSMGVPVLQSIYKMKNDIVTFHDFGGMNACSDLTGSYHVKINGDTLTLVIDEDPCDGRAGTLIIKPWIRKP